MVFDQLKTKVKHELVKTATGDREKLYHELEHQNNAYRLIRGAAYTAGGATAGVLAGSAIHDPGLSRTLGVVGGAGGLIGSTMQTRAEKIHDIKSLLRMKE